MFKKHLSILLVVVLIMSLFAGCGSQNEDETSDPNNETVSQGQESSQGSSGETNEKSQIDFDEDPYTINFPVITFGDVPADLPLVEAAINEHINPLINANVKLEVISAMEMTNIYTLKASSGEKLDLMLLLPTSTTLMPMIGSNMVLPLNDLVDEWGQGIKDGLGDVLETGKVNGNLYLIPGVSGQALTSTSIEFNAELVKKHDLMDDIKNIQTFTDLEPLLAKIKELEPDVIPFSSANSGSGFTALLGGFDDLGDTFGCLEYGSEEPYKVIDKYESDFFMENCMLMNSWYNKDYISKDTVISQDPGRDLAKAGKVFSVINTYNPVNDSGLDLDNTKDGMIEWPIPDMVPEKYTGSVSNYGLVVSTTSERPDKVVQFLNLLYTDSTLVKLLYRGIEGTNYTINEDGLIERDPNSGYYLVLDLVTDSNLIPSDAILGVDLKERLAAFDETSYVSPAFGFVFDSTPYVNEIASCNAVKDEFYAVIDSGAVDPSVEIPRFVEKLKSSGLDTIMQAKQEQLDAWVAAQDNN